MNPLPGSARLTAARAPAPLTPGVWREGPAGPPAALAPESGGSFQLRERVEGVSVFLQGPAPPRLLRTNPFVSHDKNYVSPMSLEES